MKVENLNVFKICLSTKCCYFVSTAQRYSSVNLK